MASPEVFVEYYADQQARLYGPTRQQFAELDAALGFAAAPPPNVTIVRVLQDGVVVPPPWAYPDQPATSPRVPNPADLHPDAAASIGEVMDRIAEASAGFVRSMNPKASTAPAASNTTAETSLLDADFSMPRVTQEAVYRVTAGGLVRNVSGSPVTFTFRLRNQTDNLVLASAAVTLANDAIGQRPWRFEAVGEGNFFLATGPHTVGHLMVGAGNTDPFQQAMGAPLVAAGTDPQNWRVTVQMSAASASAEVTCYTAQIMYALPGA